MRKASGQMEKFRSKAEHYRDRAEELLANAENFQDPENRITIKLLAEEYLAMADRLEKFADTIPPSHEITD